MQQLILKLKVAIMRYIGVFKLYIVLYLYAACMKLTFEACKRHKYAVKLD